MFLRTANLQVDIGSPSDVIDRIRNDLLVPVSRTPGFFAYYVLELPDSIVSTIRVFEDEASMDAATRRPHPSSTRSPRTSRSRT